MSKTQSSSVRSEALRAVTEDYVLQRCDAVYCARNLLKFSEKLTDCHYPENEGSRAVNFDSITRYDIPDESNLRQIC